MMIHPVTKEFMKAKPEAPEKASSNLTNELK